MNALRYAFRQTSRRPGLSVVVVAMLALGIGATTAMFSLFHEILMRPLPVQDPERLVNLGAPGPKPGSTSCSTSGDCEQVFSYPMFRDLEARQTVFSGLAAHRDFEANLSYEGGALAGGGLLVSGSYFDVLGLRPALGRLIAPRDEPRVDEAPVVVLSHEYWRSQFGGDRSVIGDTLTVNDRPLTIIGVAPAGFIGTTISIRPQVYVPLTLRWQMQPTVPREQIEDRRAYWLYLFARLAPGRSLEQASAGINGLYAGIIDEVEAPLNSFLPDDAMERFRQRQIIVEPGARGQSQVPDFAGRPLALLLGLTALVVLIVCVNIAHLLLARGASRTGEMAIRASIGARRRHLVAQLLAEAAVLAGIGGLLSLPIAAITLGGVAALLPEQAGIGLELRPAAMLFAGAVSIFTVLLFGLIPALRASRTDPGAAVKGQAARSAGGRGAVRFRGTLGTAQIAFSMVLLVLAGLFARSLMNVARVELGMDIDSVVTFTVSPRRSGYDPERAMGLYDRIEEALAAQPGVDAVASSSVPLLTNTNRGAGLTVEGFEAGPGVNTDSALNSIGTGFFRTLAIPLHAGRDFTEADTLDSPRVAIVNESFARKFDLEGAAVGARLGFGDERSGNAERDIEIVGLVADAKYSEVKGEVPPQLFLPRRQVENLGALAYYVRAGVGPDVLMPAIRRAVAAVDPDLPVGELTTMQRQAADNVFLDRLVAILSAGFAGLATLLAAIGLYGVLAYNVAQRRRELGLKLALGATPGRLRVMVLEQVGLMALIGLPLGLVAAVALGRAAEALLFGLSAYEPAVLAAAAIALSAVVFAAGYVPALRASRVAPMEALRHE